MGKKRRERLQRPRLVRAQQANHGLRKVEFNPSRSMDLADGSAQSPYKTSTSCWEAVVPSADSFSNDIVSCPLAEEIWTMMMRTTGLALVEGDGGDQSRLGIAFPKFLRRLVKL